MNGCGGCPLCCSDCGGFSHVKWRAAYGRYLCRGCASTWGGVIGEAGEQCSACGAAWQVNWSHAFAAWLCASCIAARSDKEVTRTIASLPAGWRENGGAAGLSGGRPPSVRLEA